MRKMSLELLLNPYSKNSLNSTHREIKNEGKEL